MRGVQDIVKRRLAGVPVPIVEFTLSAKPPHDLTDAGVRYLRRAEQRWPIERSMPVWIEHTDSISSLDVRCAVMLPVFVHADDGQEERAAHLVEKLLSKSTQIHLYTNGHIDVWNSTGYVGGICS